MMNPKNNSNQALLQLMLRVQRRDSQDPASDRGYAMVLTIVISILTFSLLGSYLLVTNINKSATAAYVDSASTFYAAESALNQRAAQIREKFIGYATPTGTSPGQTTATPTVTAANIANCLPLGITSTPSTNDFACQNYAFGSSRNDNVVYQGTNSGSGGSSFGGSGTYTAKKQTENYLAYTFVADQTNYATIGTTKLTYPDPMPIPADQAYGGLDAQEYKYTIYSTATKIDPLNPTQSIGGAAQTVLQMDFKSRIVPLFQFGVFYDGDLTMSAYSNMNIYGRVHTNKRLIFAPEGGVLLTVAGAKTSKTDSQLNYRITAAKDIYTYDSVNGGGSGTIRIVVPDGTAGALTDTLPAPDSRSISFKSLAVGKQTPLDDSASAPADYKLSNFAPYISNYTSSLPVKVLTVPGLGFTRKTDNSGEIGEYYGKADLRLTMQYNRAVPFDLSSIQTGTGAKGSSCPDTGASNMNIPANRQGRDTAKCKVLNKGQLSSLQQPVLVMTKDNTEERDRFCQQANLNDITGITAASTLTSFSAASKDKILRALQVAIASSPTPISYNKVTSAGLLPSSTQMTFKSLLDRLKTTDTSLAALDTATASVLPPAAIAAIRSSCFLPAPIQKLTNAGLTGGAVFYDNREQRAMNYLQTNVESLTVWNRDGVYVDFGTSLTTAASDYSASDTMMKINAAFDDVISATPATYSTDGLLFVRDTAIATATTGSFQKLGLAAKDRTEGGLVLHATLDDTTYPIDSIDKKRIYNAAATDRGKYQSPFGFIFNKGTNLPGPMTIASDQAVYTQGDYNNFGTNNDINTPGERQPAALIVDTITALSNACLATTEVGANPSSTPSGNNPYNVPLGQVNCVINQNARPALETTVFAAYAAHNDPSCSPLANSAPTAYCTDRSARSAYKSDRDNNTYYGGGLQNFMRMLENWTTTPYGGRQTFRYRGSMVSLGIPEEFNGVMMFLNDENFYAVEAYMIPTRDFGFDPAFNSFNQLPPLSPRAIYLKQDVFRRTYN